MPTLHLLSHSPFADDRLNSCLRLLGCADGLLLSGDAVYALSAGSAPHQALEQLPEGVELFALAEDLDARGLAVPARVQRVDYPQFVALTCRFAKVNSWL
ncbi:sulfurtransferase complex subunit TusB [Pseudomonas lalucatii]|uniref:Sulfurtransferase complex subunit TusB n=1 Tax=Pseudomonas lalucatii TaxID=1424203 RepID=A0ABS5PVE9_9PSED|nr:sulfurtransferase complex subunit TusB [Pseudomonas lalucatii]MBS7660521.1 sulfurtransferase complex subunit TusB [Pseudomonas lalucatii]MBS7691299.1 sulfurtransferase complex subunit TusB [Pseudomonas lalucatii]MBS7724610.1 sulfurtransferase complex subunit TusB [Pseudomonas lalucatii]QVM87395.1 sulfurtransferase complex subunit TusB [Pseudomonas lalucatii]